MSDGKPNGHPPPAVMEDCRILRRVDVREGQTGEGSQADAPFVGIAVDVETTGLLHSEDRIIELALRRFRYDRNGVITNIDIPYAWLEDPGRAIPPEISLLTGLTEADVKGQSIDDDEAVRLLGTGTLIIAHHSRFDRPWIEARLPDAAGLAWACTMEEIDWRARGLEGGKLGFLLMQAGWFHEGHRAGADVDAVIQLLQHRFDDGRTALSVLTEKAAQPSWIVRAVGADFSVKDLLRGRGYRWDADRKVWWREVADEDRTREEFWLAANVYAVHANPKALGPSIEEVSAFTRFQ
ncbi:MAG TPA: 3'-5' exonuclease [Allosphingosinicella sp.]|jgi:DNA polymerase-3 subunit epsilon|nr:3'-5' exonuclease [Allosphingosinicella sp.]